MAETSYYDKALAGELGVEALDMARAAKASAEEAEKWKKAHGEASDKLEVLITEKVKDEEFIKKLKDLFNESGRIL